MNHISDILLGVPVNKHGETYLSFEKTGSIYILNDVL